MIGLAIVRGNLAAASEAADVVLMRSDLKGIVTALEIARRSTHIALESVYVGIGLSAVAMLVAAFGSLPPVQGALIQEAIDVAVVLNALRALT
jgi:cation transport ATPase